MHKWVVPSCTCPNLHPIVYTLLKDEDFLLSNQLGCGFDDGGGINFFTKACTQQEKYLGVVRSYLWRESE